MACAAIRVITGGRRRRAAVGLGILGATVLVVSTGHAQTVAVPTFPVGQPTFSDWLQDVDVAPGADDSFVAIWGEYSFTDRRGEGSHAVTRRFSASGVPLGPPIMADTSAHVYDPSISADGRGGFVAAWQWIKSGIDYSFAGRILDATGAGIDRDVRMDLNLGAVFSGSVAGTPAGPAFVWSEGGLWLRLLDHDGTQRGGDWKLGGSAYWNTAAPTPEGGFVVAGTEFYSTPPGTWAQVFGPDGQQRVARFLVGESLGGVALAVDSAGGFAVVGARWETTTSASIWARRFAADGTPRGAEIVVHTVSPAHYLNPDAAYDARGNLYVVWTEFSTSPQLEFVAPQARMFDTTGAAVGPAVQISDELGAYIHTTRLANGTFANVWYRNAKAWGNIVTPTGAAPAVCGDGVRQAPEEACDDGPGNSDGTPDACRSDCQLARCGDGATDTGEACDDGNLEACDGCGARCEVEVGHACGDSVALFACGEECDDGAANSDAAPDACRSDCRPARCGDGILDGPEGCDDGNVADCDGCSFQCTVEPAPPALCAPAPLPGLTSRQRERFAAGRDEFVRTEHPGSGLGPVFNGTSCAECHNQPTIGGASPKFVTRIGRLAPNGYSFDPLTELGGSLLQAQGVSTDTCSVPGEVVPPEATFVTRRDSPTLFLLGLIEQLPAIKIYRLEDFSDRNGDGISGRASTVNQRLGRFGWKAQVATLVDFAAQAYHDEMGITNPFFPAEHPPQGGPVVCDGTPEPENDGSGVNQLTDFMRLLAPLPPLPPTTETRAGKLVFRTLACRKCHSDRLKVDTVSPITGRRQRLPIYSDLLLHDMGPGLADGIRQGSASGSEFRTPPLHGVRFSAPYLHDGRAATLEEAIAAHGGEAQSSRALFLATSSVERAALVAFLDSL
jgi:cysteine-rich repeat protein